MTCEKGNKINQLGAIETTFCGTKTNVIVWHELSATESYVLLCCAPSTSRVNRHTQRLMRTQQNRERERSKDEQVYMERAGGIQAEQESRRVFYR
jgi:hypothetical protein